MTDSEFKKSESIRLPLLTLPTHQILFPQQSLPHLHFGPSHPSLPLLETTNKLILNQSSNSLHNVIIGCVPLKILPSTPTTGRLLTPPCLQTIQLRIHQLPQPSSSDASHPAQFTISSLDPPSPADGGPEKPSYGFYQWGCSARVLKVSPLSGNQSGDGAGGYVVNLVGLRRFRIDQVIKTKSPLCEAWITYLDERPFLTNTPEERHQVDHLVKTFKSTATTFINALSAHQSSGPELDEKRNRMIGLLDRIKTRQLSRLIDIMVYSLRQCPWDDRIQFLTYNEAEVKSKKIVDLLQQLTQQLNGLTSLSKQNKSNIPTSELIRFLKSSKHLTPNQKEWLVQRRMAEIQSELNKLGGYYAQSNPQIRTIIQESNQNHNPTNSINHNGGTIVLCSAKSPLRLLGHQPIHPPEDNSIPNELEELEGKIKKAGMFKEAQEICFKELKRLRSIPPSSVEHGILKNYLDIMLKLPWAGSSSQGAHTDMILSRGFLKKARDQLDQDHFGMDRVKKRLVEFLAVIKPQADLDRAAGISTHTSLKPGSQLTEPSTLEQAADPPMSQYIGDVLLMEVDRHTSGTNEKLSNADVDPASPVSPIAASSSDLMSSEIKHKAPILLLVGPPGVGKTSIAKSIAKTLNKKFYRISLGGVKDESEIRGRRRTYVGSMLGVIVQALRRVGVNDPVILL